MSISRVPIATDGPTVSRLSYGVWRLVDGPSETTVAGVRELIDVCLELGITTFDHADIYGMYRCEERFGEALAEAPELRDRMEIVTKCGICLPLEARPQYELKFYDTSGEHVRASVEASLRHLRTDRVDLLLLHRPDPFMDPDDTAAALSELHAEGKVRAVGVSNFTPSQLELLASRLDLPIVTQQIEASVLHLEPFLDGTIDQCQIRRIRPMAWSPLAGGRLMRSDGERERRVRAELERIGERHGGVSVDVVALAWLLAHPSGAIPIVGSRRPERLRQAAGATELTLTRQEWFSIWTASAGQEVP